jgi:hypothetical protein
MNRIWAFPGFASCEAVLDRRGDRLSPRLRGSRRFLRNVAGTCRDNNRRNGQARPLPQKQAPLQPKQPFGAGCVATGRASLPHPQSPSKSVMAQLDFASAADCRTATAGTFIACW